MMSKNTFIFDFDSTLVSIEFLDFVVKDSMLDRSLEKQVDNITNMSMNGELGLRDSITSRLALANLSKKNFDNCISLITTYITLGIDGVIDFLRKNNQQIFILSAGFIRAILPVAKKLNIPQENCFANDYVLNNDGEITELLESPLLYDGGKNRVIKDLKNKNLIAGKIVMIGDGMSDCKTYLEGDADYFIGCGFNVERDKVKQKSPLFAHTVDELLGMLKHLLEFQL